MVDGGEESRISEKIQTVRRLAVGESRIIRSDTKNATTVLLILDWYDFTTTYTI